MRSATPGPPGPFDLAGAYAELQNLILDRPDVVDFLQQLAVLAASIVPGTHCGITLRRDGQIATVANSDEVAMRTDEVQYLRDRGPCLEAVRQGTRVDVPDMAVEDRWGDYAAHAMSNGIHSVCSVPFDPRRPHPGRTEPRGTTFDRARTAASVGRRRGHVRKARVDASTLS